MAQRTNIKAFMACNKCSGTILEHRQFCRATIDDWTLGPVPFYTVDLYMCANCNRPVIAVEPKDLVAKEMLQSLIGTENPISSLIAKSVEIDLNVINTPRTRTLGERRSLAGMPAIDPNKPLAK